MKRRSPWKPNGEAQGAPHHRRPLALLVAFFVSLCGLTAIQGVGPATALSGSEFQAGNIISDDLFYDSSAMTSAEIQTFLDHKIGTCQTSRCLNVAVLPVVSRAAYYSSSTGGLICSAVSGGSLRVSELIYRTQVACGISAKVILVTLQKEQGLVTSRAPSDRALEAAMGMGCPDTSPCNEAFSGLATQIITGTSQLKTYKVARFGRQPGVSYMKYNPNTSCGGTNVNIVNYATAALYNYTPYQPNAAALANLGGVGNGCSSYGNRNFWVYYNEWFGSTIDVPCTVNPVRDISQYWEGQGGAAGALGAAVSPGIVPGPVGTTIGYYTNGTVYCTPGVGAVALVGAIQNKYNAMGGPSSRIGAPIADSLAFSAAGLSGVLQNFQGGTMVSSAATGTFAVIDGPMRSAWGARGGSGGILGWPTGDQQTTPSGVWQKFQNGLLVIPTGKAAVVLSGTIGTYWSTGSNPSALGSPTGSPTSLTAGGVTGILQTFDKGMVLSSTTTGTFAVLNGPLRSAWGSTGGTAGSLGWPVGDQSSSTSGLRQDFQRGSLFASASGAGNSMSGAIGTYWATGANSERLGAPTSPPSSFSAGGVTGTLQYFETGLVLSSTATGTYSVMNGPIRDAWGARGGSGGPLGWPIADQQLSGDLQQKFQHGVLTVGAGVSGEIATYWSTGSNSARLGTSIAPATQFTAGGVAGTLQYFQRGMVLSSSATGTFAVLNGEFRAAWGSVGGAGGSLGWPTSDPDPIAGGMRQVFQHGTIIVPSAGVGVVLSGEIGAYWATGSNATLLGPPTSSPVPLTAGGVTGVVQYFDRGLVLSSTTTGTYAVLDGAYRNTWGSVGGSAGSLGWPTGTQEPISGGTRQTFQHGMIIVPTGGAGVVVSGEIGKYWTTGSNGTLLGSPVASPTPLAEGGVTGLLQTFQRGIVLSSSTTGTYAVLNGPIRTAWGASGGTSGTMGWPTGDQQALAGGVRQTFQHGTIAISSDGDPITLDGAYYRYWTTGSNETLLGPAIASPVALTAGGVTGSYQVFERGMVLSSTTTGTFAVLNGPIRTVWGSAAGTGGSLGWPIADQTTGPDGVSQLFQRGTVFVPTSGAPYLVLN